MDNNNQTPPQPIPPVQPTQPNQPAAPPPSPVQTAPRAGNKMWMWLLLAVVLVILIGGGIYWYLNNTSKSASLKPSPAPKTVNQPKQLTLSELADALDKELNSIEVQAADSDLSSIDTDLQSL